MGYNRDGEKLPQVNLGLIVGEPRGLPLAYRVYPGSIADASTLKNIIVLLEYLGVKEFTFILDRGFYSAANIQEMGKEKIQFVMPLSFSTTLASRLISKHRAALQSPLQGFYYKGRPMFHVKMFHVKDEVHINDTAVHAHVFHDERRRPDEMEHLMRRIVDIEALVHGKEFRRAEDVQAYIEKVFPRSIHLFDIAREEERFRLIRKAKAISRLMNRMGKTILITNTPVIEREELLNLYRRKDVLEKMFNTIKNELEGGRLKISSREAMEGRLFLTYLSLILYSELSRVMKEKYLFRSYTVSEVLFELKNLRAVTLDNGKVYLTEVSKKQRMLFENFEVPIPVGT
ncbi:MAG: IS1634 family transposase [Spirochaetota bacterium]